MPSSPVSASEWAVSVPAAVADLAAGAPLTPVWLNELGGITFQLGDGPARRFVKWSPPAGIALGAEVARLRWAAKFVRVPAVLEVGSTPRAAGSSPPESRATTQSASTGEQIPHPPSLRSEPACGNCTTPPRYGSARSTGRCRTDWQTSTGARLSLIPPIGTTITGRSTSSGRWRSSPTRRRSTGGSFVTATPVRRTPFFRRTVGTPGGSTLARWASPTGGRIWRWRPGARSGTTAPAGSDRCLTRTASSRTRNAPRTTACSGSWARDPCLVRTHNHFRRRRPRNRYPHSTTAHQRVRVVRSP